ncbi:lysophospholipase [Bradyrhizobium sp. SZCCHNPS2010]|uniref:alpha/beta hydrolase family protein n=1 Tax=Bradyrhizobium sp. SZCCHNPS2010 TaxID=3057333 RepID=UPI0029160D31|nr:lysophospholipase [Bradyrhizobium sp. SZCCHNPS2010]
MKRQMTGHDRCRANADIVAADPSVGLPEQEFGLAAMAGQLSRRRLLTSASLAFGAAALSIPGGPAVARPQASSGAGLGRPVRVTKDRLDALAAKFHAVFNEHNILPPFSADKQGARVDVELRRLTTFTRVPETGERVKVSGLLALPAGHQGPLPVVSWQHGTILSFDQVPSNLIKLADPNYELRDNVDSIETLFNIQRLVGNGFALIAADYLGKGPYRDGRGEAYAVKDATVQCCLDVLNAGLLALDQLGFRKRALFLNGWSQGALNTQWLRQELQRRRVKVAASAAQSPFNNLPESMRYWVTAGADPSADSAYPKPPIWITPCVIILLGSYRLQYRLTDLFKTAIKPQHIALAEKYWSDYSMDDAFSRAVPQPPDLLVDGFFDRFTHETNSRFLRHLAANSTTYWDYDAPMRFYYGAADEALPPRLVKMSLAANGHFMQGVSVAGASHRGTFLASLYGEGDVVGGNSTVLDWFKSAL